MNELFPLAYLKVRILRNKLRQLKEHSRLKIWVISIFIVVYLVGSYCLFYEGLCFFESFMGIGPLLTNRLLFLFFLALLFMLVFSNVTIAFSVFYRSRETDFLFSLPVHYSSIFSINSAETFLLSSWASLFLAGPLMLAFGIVKDAPWWFYVGVVCFFIPFLLVSTATGISLCILTARFFSERRSRIALGIMFSVVIVMMAFSSEFMLIASIRREPQSMVLVQQFLHQFSLSKFALSPHSWITKGILALLNKDILQQPGQLFTECLIYFSSLLSTGLVGVVIAFSIAKKFYYPSWSDLKGTVETRYYQEKAATRIWSDKILPVLFDSSTIGMVRKDIKIFSRDAAQWSQFLIFFGLLALYILNLRNFAYDIAAPFWKNLVSFLNLTAMGLTLSTLTTRFVYPQISLEGLRFWIIGLAPIKKSKIILQKFWLSFLLSFLITEALMILSNIMLRVNPYVFWLTTLTVLVMSITLSGLAAGLGALYPHFKGDNPARIVAGFGGTFTLILSLAYIALVVGLEALPLHLLVTNRLHSMSLFYGMSAVSIAAVLLLSVLLCLVPLRLGIRQLERQDF